MKATFDKSSGAVVGADTAPAPASAPTADSAAAPARSPQMQSGPRAAGNDGFTKELRPNTEKISCPFLASAFNQRLLNPEADGTLSVEQAEALLASVGFSKDAAQVFVGAADDADPHLPKAFNLFGMRDNVLNHTGSSRVRDRKVDPERIHELLSFGENGRMYRKHFAAAANHYRSNTDGQGSPLRGTAIQTLEFTTALLVFGRVDARGERYLTNQDIEGLWLKNVFPSDWQPPASGSIELVDLAGRTARMGLSRLWAGLLSLLGLNGRN